MTGDKKGMLDFAGQWWHTSGAQADAIHDEFGMTVTRFYQILNRLLDREDALAYNPAVVKRLRRQRTPRRS